jgi:hypothetical protein
VVLVTNRWVVAAKHRAVESAQEARSRAQTPREAGLLVADECRRFAVLACSAGALAAGGLATVVVGVVVEALYGVHWLFVLATALLAAAGALAFHLATRLAAWKEVLARPRKRNQVFISYRTREHAEEAAEAARILGRRSLGCFLARPGTMTKGTDHPLRGFQALKLFQLGGLDADLQRELIASDSMVFFIPGTASRPKYLQELRDFTDAAIAAVLFCNGLSRTFWRFIWYASIYGKQVMPRLSAQIDNRSWQDWEMAIARQLGLVLVRVSVDPAGGGGDDDEEVIRCRRDSFASDFAARVLPRLSAAVRDELEVTPIVPLIAAYVLVGLITALTLVLIVVGASLLLVLYFGGVLALAVTLAAVSVVLGVRAILR